MSFRSRGSRAPAASRRTARVSVPSIGHRQFCSKNQLWVFRTLCDEGSRSAKDDSLKRLTQLDPRLSGPRAEGYARSLASSPGAIGYKALLVEVVEVVASLNRRRAPAVSASKIDLPCLAPTDRSKTMVGNTMDDGRP
jgi:hypothetical protein